MQTTLTRPPIRQDRLTILMALYNVKGAEVARRVGISHHHLSKILHGRQGVSHELLARIERAIVGLPCPSVKGGE